MRSRFLVALGSMTPLTRGHAGDGDEGEQQSLAEHGGCGGVGVDVCVCVWCGRCTWCERRRLDDWFVLAAGCRPVDVDRALFCSLCSACQASKCEDEGTCPDAPTPNPSRVRGVHQSRLRDLTQPKQGLARRGARSHVSRALTCLVRKMGRRCGGSGWVGQRICIWEGSSGRRFSKPAAWAWAAALQPAHPTNPLDASWATGHWDTGTHTHAQTTKKEGTEAGSANKYKQATQKQKSPRAKVLFFHRLCLFVFCFVLFCSAPWST